MCHNNKAVIFEGLSKRTFFPLSILPSLISEKYQTGSRPDSPITFLIWMACSHSLLIETQETQKNVDSSLQAEGVGASTKMCC